jgi:acyl-homoserine-lactone acylase
LTHPHLPLTALLAAAVMAAVMAAPAPGHGAPDAPEAAGGEARPTAAREQMRWQREARAVSIVRDSWGIAHVYGGTDADAVFGAMYAQAEDDFPRIERNYLVALGRLAQIEGRSALYSDVRQRMFVDPAQLERLYRDSPIWLKSLMIAWADGLNFYLAGQPRLNAIGHFEPWMALSFTEGSIGGDIESADLAKLEQLYPDGAGRPLAPPIETPASPPPPAAPPAAALAAPEEAGGSNGFAIAPSRTASGHALLWINPHTSFYFRAELQLTSDQGLDVYGAATWGQFFVYQGFNAHNGWMHTSYGGDAIDEYAESVLDTPQGPGYRYAGGVRPLARSVITVLVKQDGRLVAHRFTVYRSHHGPIVRAEGGQWIALKIFQDPVRALAQSYLRTKTTDYKSFRRTQEMRTDTSNNTVYADADGTIAYFHGNFIPRRDARVDFSRPVDGSDPATEWHGAHRLEETITLLNPSNGWIQNTNNWPFSAAGAASPKRENYPAYMWTRGENPRGLHAIEVLEKLQGATLDSLIAAAYDPHLTAFDALLPPLLAAYDRLGAGDPRRTTLREPIASLRVWDRRSAAESIPTTLAVVWGEQLAARAEARADAANEPLYDHLIAHLTDDERLEALSGAIERLERDMGSWKIAWGEINRFQRLNDDRVPLFDDAKQSLPVGFAPAQWGSLASFDYSRPRTTHHIFGSIGNSFVAAVDFGPTVRAKAIMTGGESGDRASPHFADQALMYSEGRFRDVWFTPADVSAHAERRYHPGER